MPKPNWDTAVDLSSVEVRIGNQVGEIRFRGLEDGRIDARYWTAWDRNDPDVVKPTKGGFTLRPEDLIAVGQMCMELGRAKMESGAAAS